MMSQRISNIEVKKNNRNQIFRYINNHERISKQEIANVLGMSMPTVLQNTNELLERGLIHEVGEFDSTGGRKAKMIDSVSNARFAVGLDITKNHISLVLTNLSGNVLNHIRIHKPFLFTDKYFKELGEQIALFIEKTSVPTEKILGVGISIPGIIDPVNKKIAFSHALGISDVMCDKFTQFVPYSCIFINDANAAGIAELRGMEEKHNFVYISLSNSVGGAIILDHKLYLGENWRSGEFGHFSLVPNGKRCYCGKLGCVDVYCSAKNLSQNTNENLKQFFDQLAAGDENLQTIWEEYLSYLAIVVNNLRMAFDCNVIIGGYVGSFIEPYLKDLQEKSASLNIFGLNAQYIQSCRYRLEASALGAALQHIETFISTI